MTVREKEPAIRHSKGTGVRLDRRRLVLRFRAFLPSTRESIRFAVDKVMQLVGEAGCPRGDAEDIEIALREALANAIIHGNRSQPEKKVLLRCYGDPMESSIFLAVRDEGEGFDPRRVPDPRDDSRLHLPHGRGVFLMHELMDHAEHRKGGREVVLYKCCVGARRRRGSGRAGRARRTR